ncbi:MAG TPA: hypothetical protein VJ820_12245, partial [Propionibacteriaceae bacterium]|nr:hypothetical protein [Propionibacteriaceae bacterium]
PKEWLAAQPAAATLRALRSRLDRFAAYYNTVRPTRRWPNAPPPGPKPPAKAIPTNLKITAHYRVRNDTIDTGSPQPAPRHPAAPAPLTLTALQSGD